jgi:hypothetical protein
MPSVVENLAVDCAGPDEPAQFRSEAVGKPIADKAAARD